MSGLQRKLLAVAIVLAGLSAFTHWSATSRADRFERGQKLLPHLDPDEIASIEIRSSDGSVTLEREGEYFLIAEENGYRAKNEEVNRIVRDLQAVTLAKRVGAGETLAAELGFGGPPDGDAAEAPGDASATRVTLHDATGGEMLSLEIGGAPEDGGGTYLRRSGGEDDAIYLTESVLRVAAAPDRFLDTEILDVQSSEIERVEGPDFVLARAEAEDGGETEPRAELELVAVPAGHRSKSLEVNKVKNLPSRLRFEEVLVADDPEVRDLEFEQRLRYDLTDGSGYVFEMATAGERTFLRLTGFHTVDRVEITMETTEEEMEEKSDTLHRADEIDRFNAYHGSWVYEVDASTAERLAVTKSSLLEAA